jgi:hypothetical protein
MSLCSVLRFWKKQGGAKITKSPEKHYTNCHYGVAQILQKNFQNTGWRKNYTDCQNSGWVKTYTNCPKILGGAKITPEKTTTG